MVWKGIILVARFYTFMCEQGQMDVDKVKFGQVSNIHEEEWIINANSSIWTRLSLKKKIWELHWRLLGVKRGEGSWRGQLWPKQTTLLRSNGLDGDTMQFWREIDYVMLETLMGGTQGEEAHVVYKEEDGSHLRLVWWLLILWYAWILCLLQLFSWDCSVV